MSSRIELKKDIVFKELKENILSGALKSGHKLKNELALSRELGVAKKTLRSALSRLEDEGLIARLPAKGTFVLGHESWKPQKAERKVLVVSEESGQVHMPANYIIPGIENKMSELGFDSIYCSFDYILSLSPDDAEKSFKNSGINGLIFCSNYLHGNERSLQILKKTGLPGVIPHTHRAKDAMVSGYAVQVFDEKGSFKTAICHLAEKGHCRIGSIMHKGFTPNFRNYSKDEYFNLLESLGMETKNEFFKLTSYEPEEIKSATEELMKTHIPPTAIMCYSDFYAIHVYSALKNMSLKIPEDVAVMGYCGYPGGELMSPSLSTVDLQYFELGKSAVELLARSDEWFDVKEKTAPPIIQTNYKLIARESTAIKRLERKMKGLAV